MVIILSDARNPVPFEIPRQLTKIQGEPLVKRTIRLLKENGVKDILVTSHDKRFDNLGATRYEPKYNDYIPDEQGYWVSAFPLEILNEPTIYLFGDVYYSEKAIKTILETPTNDILFFCTYKNKSPLYIKEHDEPLAFKVTNIEKFKEHIQKIKDFKDSGNAPREPITWELYRSIHNQELTKHIMTDGYIVINDESCDIDTKYDIIKLEKKLGGNVMVKVKALQKFTLEKFNELKNIQRFNPNRSKEGELYINDIFECNSDMVDYLLGNNPLNLKVVEIIEVIPEEAKEEIKPKKVTKKKTTKKK